jgi:hypothetical protein
VGKNRIEGFRQMNCKLLVLVLPVLVASLQQVASHAAPRQQAVRVFVDGRLINLSPAALTVAGRVMVPLRGTFEAMGASVSFMPPRTIVILRGSRVVQLDVGNRVARVNDTPVALDVPAIAVGGYTYVPLRFAGEALGAVVYFDRATRIVEIFTTPESAEQFPEPQPVPEAQPVPVPFPPPSDPQTFPTPLPAPRPARPTVIFPLPGTSVGNPVGVQGTAPGATRVRVSVTVPLVGITIGSAEAAVLPVLGVFSASVSYPALFGGLPLSINVVSIDGAGVESEPATVFVRQG